MTPLHKAGLVAVAGRPNAGKSTLLNQLVGEKLAITSPKAQSTRHRIVGIRSDPGCQMVLLDTPGLLEPQDDLHRAMRVAALGALRDADLILHLADAGAGDPPALQQVAALETPPRAPVLVVLNKIDRLTEEQRTTLALTHPEAIPVSALTGEGIPALLAAIATRLPDSPSLYPEDELSTQPVRFFCAELVRETALEQLGDELPHALACEIEEFREGTTPLYIRAVLHVERDSQKAIVIGANGQQIKKLGRSAREKIERLVGAPVYLDLWVKVLPNWRRKRHALLRFGYDDPSRAG
jgi:GTP-binding protein Era